MSKIELYLQNGRYCAVKSEKRRTELKEKSRLTRFTQGIMSSIFDEYAVVKSLNKKY